MHMRMPRSPARLALFALLGAAAIARADDGAPLSIDPRQSTLTYHLVHKLHRFDGVSRLVEGRARLLPDGRAQVMVRAPVDSFDSANANRDAHMKETVEAARYPTVELKAAGQVARPTNFPSFVDAKFIVQITFHGEQKTFEVPVKLTFDGPGQIRAKSHFVLSLDAFKVERPSLMFVKVEDEMAIDADLVFQH
jgi:hypothetical protein